MGSALELLWKDGYWTTKMLFGLNGRCVYSFYLIATSLLCNVLIFPARSNCEQTG